MKTNRVKMSTIRTLLVVVVIGVIFLFFFPDLFFGSSSQSTTSTTDSLSNTNNNEHDDGGEAKTSSSLSVGGKPSKNAAESDNDNAYLKRHDQTLCVLPVGDSLTQGVANFRGYRYFIKKTIPPGGGGDGGGAAGGKDIVFVGTRRGTCALGKPSLFHNALSHSPAQRHSGGLHEGHCSWGARLLREQLMKVLVNSQAEKEQTAVRLLKKGDAVSDRLHEAINCVVDERAGNGNGFDAKKEVRLRIDVALLMIGHNNVFQIASSCRLKEGRPLSGKAQVWMNVLGDLDTAEEQAFVRVLDSKMLCAWNGFKTDFLAQHTAIIQQLLSRTDGSTRVVVGLNPPTGFPNLDAMLHAILKISAKKHGERVTTVDFPDFGNAKNGVRHTFDSTHPNDEGAKVLAKGWYGALEGQVDNFNF